MKIDINTLKVKLKKVTPYIIILVATLVTSIPLLFETTNIMADDGIQHICRIIENFKEMQNGNYYPEIYSRICNNFGYSWNIFYSPFTSFAPLIFMIFTNSFVTCMKIFLATIMFFSGIMMYKYIKEITQNKYISTLGATFYMIAPYHLTDMYIRNAIAEFCVFPFIPMVFLGLENIINGNQKKQIYLMLGAIGLILTHTIFTILTIAFCIIYLIVNYKKLKNIKTIKILIISAIFIICITSFFTLPLVEHKINGEYEVFKSDRMASQETYKNAKIYLLDIIDVTYSRFSVGIIIIIGTITFLITIKELDKQFKKQYITLLMLGIFSLLCATVPLTFGDFSEFIQFPFRFLVFGIFFLSITSSIGFGTTLKNFNFKDVLVLFTIFALLQVPIYEELEQRKDSNKAPEEALIQGIRVTEETGRVHAGMASMEYLPTKAFENRWYIEQRKDEIYILDGDMQISEYSKTTQRLETNINTYEQTKIELPYIYYLGYKVEIKTQTETLQLETYESDYGFLEVTIPNNIQGKLTVEYDGTSIMKITKLISAIGVVGLIIYCKKIKKDT